VKTGQSFVTMWLFSNEEGTQQSMAHMTSFIYFCSTHTVWKLTLLTL